MKTAIAIIIKLFVTLAAAWISFMVFGMTAFWTMVMIAAAGTVLNYLIGDLLVLPRFGNLVASVLDGVLAGALAWMVLAYLPVTYYFMTSVYLFAAMVAIFEAFFHMYLLGTKTIVKKKSDEDFYKKHKLNYNTETGSEIYPYLSRDDNERKDRDGTLNSGYNKSVNLHPDSSSQDDGRTK